LLLASQNEVYRGIEEKARLWQPHRDVESRKLHEADLQAALEETKEEMLIVERTYNALLDEAEAELADLKSK
jgi:hypothetical protein